MLEGREGIEPPSTIPFGIVPLGIPGSLTPWWSLLSKTSSLSFKECYGRTDVLLSLLSIIPLLTFSRTSKSGILTRHARRIGLPRR